MSNNKEDSTRNTAGAHLRKIYNRAMANNKEKVTKRIIEALEKASINYTYNQEKDSITLPLGNIGRYDNVSIFIYVIENGCGYMINAVLPINIGTLYGEEFSRMAKQICYINHFLKETRFTITEGGIVLCQQYTNCKDTLPSFAMVGRGLYNVTNTVINYSID